MFYMGVYIGFKRVYIGFIWGLKWSGVCSPKLGRICSADKCFRLKKAHVAGPLAQSQKPELSMPQTRNLDAWSS